MSENHSIYQFLGRDCTEKQGGSYGGDVRRKEEDEGNRDDSPFSSFLRCESSSLSPRSPRQEDPLYLVSGRMPDSFSV